MTLLLQHRGRVSLFVIVEQIELWNKKRERRRCRDQANNALKAGRIQRSDSCQICGSREAALEMHHHSYAPGKGVQVIWTCRSCHLQADKLRAAREAGKPLEFEKLRWDGNLRMAGGN